MVFVVWTCTIRVVSTRDFSPSCQDVELHVSAVYVRAWYNVYFEPGSDTCSFLPFFILLNQAVYAVPRPFFFFFRHVVAILRIFENTMSHAPLTGLDPHA